MYRNCEYSHLGMENTIRVVQRAYPHTWQSNFTSMHSGQPGHICFKWPGAEFSSMRNHKFNVDLNSNLAIDGSLILCPS